MTGYEIDRTNPIGRVAVLFVGCEKLHVMQRLNKEENFAAYKIAFFADRKPVEELNNVKIDPDEMTNEGQFSVAI